MGGRTPSKQDVPVAETSIARTGRSLRDPSAVTLEARRLVGFERQYHCHECGTELRSWTRLSACPECGEPFVAAVIRRAATAGA